MPQQITSSPYLTSLTPLRGIAALLIVMQHCSLFFGNFVPFFHTGFFDNAWVCVDFFFILSGFILSYSYAPTFAKKYNWSNYKSYLVSRFARIYPLHFVTWVWAFVVVLMIVHLANSIDPSIRDLFNLKAFVPGLLLIQDFHLYKASPVNFPAWSLSAEWLMYLIFPIVVPLFNKLSSSLQILMLIVLLIAYIILRYMVGPHSATSIDGQPTLNMIADFGAFRCMVGFMVGMLLYRFYTKWLGYKFIQQTWFFIVIAVAIVACLHFGINEILTISLFPLLILAAAYNTSGIQTIFKKAPLQRLGDWSFSIYMVHGPIILTLICYSVYLNPSSLARVSHQTDHSQFTKYQVGLKYMLCIVAATLIVAVFTYNFIEKPAGKYLKNKFR